MQQIGEKIGLVMQSLAINIVAMDLTRSDIEAFMAYLDEQDAIMPLIDPTAWQRAGRHGIPKAKRRCEVLLPLVDLVQEEKP